MRCHVMPELLMQQAGGKHYTTCSSGYCNVVHQFTSDIKQ